METKGGQLTVAVDWHIKKAFFLYLQLRKKEQLTAVLWGEGRGRKRKGNKTERPTGLVVAKRRSTVTLTNVKSSIFQTVQAIRVLRDSTFSYTINECCQDHPSDIELKNGGKVRIRSGQKKSMHSKYIKCRLTVTFSKKFLNRCHQSQYW